MADPESFSISSVAAEVRARMASLATAERRLDAEGVLSHFDSNPETVIYNDGQRLSYSDLAEGLLATFQHVKSIEGSYERMDVHPLAPDSALVSVEFREQVVDAEDESAASSGIATWLWRKQGEQWRIVYGHAEHYPDA